VSFVKIGAVKLILYLRLYIFSSFSIGFVKKNCARNNHKNLLSGC